MKSELQLAALKYAQSLVTFHEMELFAKKSGLSEDKIELRARRDKMYDAMNELDAACQANAFDNVKDML